MIYFKIYRGLAILSTKQGTEKENIYQNMYTFEVDDRYHDVVYLPNPLSLRYSSKNLNEYYPGLYGNCYTISLKELKENGMIILEK